ncbi:MAG: hypothetical protein ACK5DE_02630 [Bacteroidota bacterium]
MAEVVTTPNLRELALDIVEGKVFGSWQLRNPERELSMVFMVLLFAKKEDLPTDIGAVYEYLHHASKQCINGMPIFYSCRFLTMQQYKDVCDYVKEAREHRKSFLEPNAKESKIDPAGHSQPANTTQQLDSRGGASRSERDSSSGSESTDDPASNRLRKLFERKSGSPGFASKARS